MAINEAVLPAARRVILFGIDGGGTFFDNTLTPCIDRHLVARGAVCHRVLTEIPTVSAECWGSMLHGVPCETHRLTNWIASRVPFPPDSPIPSVFRALHEARPEAKMASFCDWNAINVGIIEDGLGVHKYTACDYALIAPAIEYIKQNPDFSLIYFQFDSVDHNGHEYGYGSPEHLAAITANDCYIAKIVEALEENNLMDGTVLMVEADHGGTPGDGHGHGGGHGGDSDAEKYVFFAAAGGDIKHTEITGMLVRDTAPVILRALGVPQPESWTGRVPAGLFPALPADSPLARGAAPRSETARKNDSLRPEIVHDGNTSHSETARDGDASRSSGAAVQEITPARTPETGDFLRAFADFSPLFYDSFETIEHSSAHGKLYAVPGRVGNAARFDDGFLALPCPDLTGGFSLCGWLRPETDRFSADTVCAYTMEETAQKPAFTLRLSGDYFRFVVSLADEIKPLDAEFSRPRSMIGQWGYIACAVDTIKNEIRFSVNFAPFIRWALPEGKRLRPVADTLRIGDPARLPAEWDDLCLCRHILTDGDLSRLKTYYNA